jgi:hypothetical protein
VTEAERLPWDFVLLGAAAIALLASALTYGVPSLLVGAGIAWRAIKKKIWRDPKILKTRPILAAAAGLVLVGFAVGIVVSTFWWHREYTR